MDIFPHRDWAGYKPTHTQAEEYYQPIDTIAGKLVLGKPPLYGWFNNFIINDGLLRRFVQPTS